MKKLWLGLLVIAGNVTGQDIVLDLNIKDTVLNTATFEVEIVTHSYDSLLSDLIVNSDTDYVVPRIAQIDDYGFTLGSVWYKGEKIGTASYHAQSSESYIARVLNGIRNAHKYNPNEFSYGIGNPNTTSGWDGGLMTFYNSFKSLFGCVISVENYKYHPHSCGEYGFQTVWDFESNGIEGLEKAREYFKRFGINSSEIQTKTDTIYAHSTSNSQTRTWVDINDQSFIEYPYTRNMGYFTYNYFVLEVYIGNKQEYFDFEFNRPSPYTYQRDTLLSNIIVKDVLHNTDTVVPDPVEPVDTIIHSDTVVPDPVEPVDTIIHSDTVVVEEPKDTIISPTDTINSSVDAALPCEIYPIDGDSIVALNGKYFTYRYGITPSGIYIFRNRKIFIKH